MNKSIVILSMGMFALGLDAYVIAGILPNIAKTYDVDLSVAGLSVATFTVCYALSAPLFATLLARRPAKIVLCSAFALFTAANVLSACAATFPIFVLSRALAGAGAGLYSPSAVASAAVLAAKERHGRALGFILGGMSTGTVVGVPAGLAVAERAGWHVTFWIIAALGTIGLLGLSIFFPSVAPPSPPSIRERLALLKDKQVLQVVAVTFLISVASLGLYTYVAPFLAAAGQSPHLMAVLWAWGIGGIAGSFLVGHVIDWTRNKERIIGWIAVLLLVIFVTLPFGAQTGLPVAILFFAWGMLGWASQAPQQHTLLTLRSDHGAAAVALNSSANYLGSAAGALGGGVFLANVAGAAALPFAAAACVLLALIVWILVQALAIDSDAEGQAR